MVVQSPDFGLRAYTHLVAALNRPWARFEAVRTEGSVPVGNEPRHVRICSQGADRSGHTSRRAPSGTLAHSAIFVSRGLGWRIVADAGGPVKTGGRSHTCANMCSASARSSGKTFKSGQDHFSFGYRQDEDVYQVVSGHLKAQIFGLPPGHRWRAARSIQRGPSAYLVGRAASTGYYGSDVLFRHRRGPSCVDRGEVGCG